MTEALLNQLYSNPKHGVAFQSADVIHKKALRFDPNIDKKTVINFIRSKFSYSQFARKVKKFPKRKIWSLFPGKLLSIDLLELSQIQKRVNKPYSFIFCCIDIFSGYLEIVPLKNKSTSEILVGLKRCFNLTTPISLLSDGEPGFFSKEVKDFLRERDVKLVTQKASAHLAWKNGNVESSQRYLKRLIVRFSEEFKIKRFINYLHHIQDIFNAHTNRNTGFKPEVLRFDKNAIASHQEKVTRELQEAERQIDESKLLKIGTFVHIRLLDPSVFAKETQKKFSKQVFMIVEVKKSSPATYKVYPVPENQDRYFYSQELFVLDDEYGQKNNFATPIEKIVQKRELRNRTIYECAFIGNERKAWLTSDEIRDRFILFQNDYSKEILNNSNVD